MLAIKNSMSSRERWRSYSFFKPLSMHFAMEVLLNISAKVLDSLKRAVGMSSSPVMI
jgi:hypothetical protein